MRYIQIIFINTSLLKQNSRCRTRLECVNKTMFILSHKIALMTPICRVTTVAVTANCSLPSLLQYNNGADNCKEAVYFC